MKRTPLTRRARLKPRNAKRAAARRVRDFGPQAELCRTLPCCVCCARPSDPHHEPPRSVGGRDADTVPLCRACHDKRHQVGAKAFWGWEFDWRPVRDDLRERVRRDAA